MKVDFALLESTRVVTLDDIKAEDWTLNISRYVLPPLGTDISPLDEAIRSFKVALAHCREAEDQLRQVIAGKISDTEYKEQREKITKEAD